MRPLVILPMMIVVAMLSFSVRLLDFYVGMSPLSGSAYAAKEAPAAHEEVHVVEEGGAPDQDGLLDAGVDGGADLHVEAQANMNHVDEEVGSHDRWRDASDEDIGITSLKMEMYEDLVERRKALDQREKQLQTREALLTAAEMELDRKYQELNQLRRKIEGLLEQQSEEEKARIESLVKIYEGMKAKEAASIFDTLDLDILVLVLSNMSERKLSPILAKMNPERARTVTIMLAEQKQLPALPQ